MNEQKQEQLQKVLQEHPELNDRLKAMTADSQTELQEKMIELLKEYGVVLTAEDFKMPEGKLSDDELAAVAGGGGCGCWGGGGGDYLICGCVLVGSGGIKGIEDLSDYGGCVCVGDGVGATNWGNVTPHEITDKEELDIISW